MKVEDNPACQLSSLPRCQHLPTLLFLQAREVTWPARAEETSDGIDAQPSVYQVRLLDYTGSCKHRDRRGCSASAGKRGAGSFVSLSRCGRRARLAGVQEAACSWRFPGPQREPQCRHPEGAGPALLSAPLRPRARAERQPAAREGISRRRRENGGCVPAALKSFAGGWGTLRPT